jgi:hypothetical protein
LKNKSEFYAVPELKKQSFSEKINNYFKSMMEKKNETKLKTNSPLTKTNIQATPSSSSKPPASSKFDSYRSASGASEISKIFRDIIQDNEPTSKNNIVVPEPITSINEIESKKKEAVSKPVEIKSVLKKPKPKDNRSMIDKLKDKVPCKRKPKVEKQPKPNKTKVKVEKKEKEEKPTTSENASVNKQNESVFSKLYRKSSVNKNANIKTEEENKTDIPKKQAKEIAKQKKIEEAKKLKEKKKEEKLKKEIEKKVKKEQEKQTKKENGKKAKKENEKPTINENEKKKTALKAPANNKETFYSRLFGKKNNKQTKKTQFKEGEVKEIVTNRRIFDDDLPGSNDNLRLSELRNNEIKFNPPSSIDSSFNDLRNSKVDDDEPNEYRYDLNVIILSNLYL